MIKKISIATCLFFLTIVGAHAVTAKVGLALNHAVYGANGTERNFNVSGAVEKTTKKDGAAFVDTYGSIFLEGAINDVVSMGVEYVPMDIETPQNRNPEPDGDVLVSAAFNWGVSLACITDVRNTEPFGLLAIIKAGYLIKIL